MKRGTSILVIVGCIVSCLAATAAPIIWVETTTYNFEDVVEGESVEHSFMIENRGDEVLVISSAYGSCGCTVTSLETKELVPGETTSLHATLRTNGYGGLVVSKSITVASNDPETPQLTLFLTGEVLNEPMCQVLADDFMARFYILIDLREPAEYAEGHIIGAINIPLTELTLWMDLFPLRVDIILYDQDGSTAYTALQRLSDSGVANACALAGGLQGWIAEYGTGLVVSFKLMPSSDN